MKKLIALVFALVCVLSLFGCGKNNTYEIGIVLSPDEIEVGGYQEELDYSDEEISPIDNKIIIDADACPVVDIAVGIAKERNLECIVSFYQLIF